MGPSAGQKKQDSLVYVGEDLSGTVVKLIEVMATVIFDTNPGSLINKKNQSMLPGKKYIYSVCHSKRNE